MLTSLRTSAEPCEKPFTRQLGSWESSAARPCCTSILLTTFPRPLVRACAAQTCPSVLFQLQSCAVGNSS